jgi:hypothetical protein
MKVVPVDHMDEVLGPCPDARPGMNACFTNNDIYRFRWKRVSADQARYLSIKMQPRLDFGLTL